MDVESVLQEGLLLESATGAARSRDTAGRIQPSAAWADLSEAQREELFERQLAAGVVERALDPAGVSSTARAVLERAAGLGQL